MKARMIFAVGMLGTLAGSPAFASDDGVATGATDSKLRLQLQVEMLPVGSGKVTVGGDSTSNDTAVAYGITGMFDYAVTPYLSVGVAPRVVLNSKSKDAPASEDASKEIDLRARIMGHVPVWQRLEVYASVMPGYTIVTSTQDGQDSATGFAIGGAAGASYDVSPTVFVAAEVGYQRAFTSATLTAAGQMVSADLDLSYMHVGLGAGIRF